MRSRASVCLLLGTLLSALALQQSATADNGHAFAGAKAAGASKGKTYFIANNGDDRNPGTIDRPFATIYKAHQVVGLGDTINFRAGTYPALISWHKPGTATAPITIQAHQGEDVTLYCSEQYTWSRVNDPALGDCWKATIPNLPNPYPGVQKTVWEDAAGAATNPGVSVGAIVKNGYMCVAAHSAADFARPETGSGVRLTDSHGRLLFDLTWYDRGTKTLWFKAGPSPVNDPSSQLYATSSSSGQFSISGSYLRLGGLKIKYLSYFHQQDNPTQQEITNCEIKHGGGGICGGGTRCTYTSLFIDKMGGRLVWRNGGYDRAYLDHCFYFNGTQCLISNCFFGRTTMGGPIQNYPYGFTDNVFDGNVLYNSSGGSIFMGTGNNVIKNNISLQKTYGVSPYISMQDFTFAHNYSEAASPFSFACAEANGAYRETFEKFAIIDNVFNTTGGCVDYRGNIVDASKCNIDGNVYLGTPSWRVGLTQAKPPAAKYQAYATYASYVAGLQALPNCGSWEKKSQARPTAPRFDFASFDAFLDADPPLAAVLRKARQYVKGVIAAFQGAGPAIDPPPAGHRG